MTDDDRFDEFLRSAARDYHRPPETPRDAIWMRVQAGRAARSAPRRLGRAGSLWWRVGAIAATLLIGVAVGRLSIWPTDTAPRAVAVVPPDTAPDTSVAVAELPEAAAPSGPLPRAARTPSDPAMHEPRPRASDSPLARGHAAPSSPYRLAAVQHLDRAEALLTTLRADRRTGRLDEGIPEWARELLSTTRLLLDSPAADDTKLHRLLVDLEFVLAQIAQLQRDRQPSELELIEQAVEGREMLFRLRTVAPSVPPRAGT